jgi:hypothetical protein
MEVEVVSVPDHQAGKREFRSWAREHHPDMGGDPAVFAEGLERWRAGRGSEAPSMPKVMVYRRRPWMLAWAGDWLRHRRWRRSVRVR